MGLFGENGVRNEQGRDVTSENLLTREERRKERFFKKKYCSLTLQVFCVIFMAFLAYVCFYYRPIVLCIDSDGKQGICIDIFKCPFIKNDFKEEKKPVFCELNKDKVTVCCVENDMPMMEARHLRPTSEETTTNINERTDDYTIVFVDPSILKVPDINNGQCKPMTNYTNTGRISFQKCLEYQDKLVFPCLESLTPNTKVKRMQYCNWKPDAMISEGTATSDGEFPHMALLGYDLPDHDTWLCDGVIVSDRFILTAAHCTYSKDAGVVTKVRIGFWKKSQKIQPDELYSVSEIYKHPQYKPRYAYNDIALLKTDRIMMLNRYRVPACLHDGSPINDTTVTVTGWGTLDPHHKRNSDILRKVKLEKFSDEECAQFYKPSLVRHMPRGYDSNKQICYGDRWTSKDSSKGDSGGPAQISHHLECMYLVTAIVSNGKKFGHAGLPGIYTRVAPYIDWIESIVWLRN
ncbi:serine protease persephone-like isoform X1 [Nymphalis io]|uniref:serine protease persephone-like isoform X1 n=1 Tax=Inachis io TaxID=171585 RepID=UPI0021684677|nr:serine protease persephone-like isoform X1 [Nymphalis io]XP_050359573.1 serine protease persephone-like isoform X1 [Nymphalis io]XP_050359574.1 serine protease persephone-like isoform X1 [Nymphalis io]XP_050359576.1 serine protease persephone-like isoform X1 [Nymphalis io]